VIPYLSIDGAAKAIDFYTRVLGATERMRMDAPGGKIGHAELEIGKSLIMLADVFPEAGNTAAKPGAGSPVSIMVYVEDVDAVVQKAVDAGATLTRKVEDQFYGDRAGQIVDPFGHKWFIATHVEDVPPEEMAKRAAAAMDEG
jgi:PhnB protein